MSQKISKKKNVNIYGKPNEILLSMSSDHLTMNSFLLEKAETAKDKVAFVWENERTLKGDGNGGGEKESANKQNGHLWGFSSKITKRKRESDEECFHMWTMSFLRGSAFVKIRPRKEYSFALDVSNICPLRNIYSITFSLLAIWIGNGCQKRHKKDEFRNERISRIF